MLISTPLLRPVFGHQKQGATYGHTKVAGRQVLQKGLSPLATIISTPGSAPLACGVRLRAGKAGSGKLSDPRWRSVSFDDRLGASDLLPPYGGTTC